MFGASQLLIHLDLCQPWKWNHQTSSLSSAFLSFSLVEYGAISRGFSSPPSLFSSLPCPFLPSFLPSFLPTYLPSFLSFFLFLCLLPLPLPLPLPSLSLSLSLKYWIPRPFADDTNVSASGNNASEIENKINHDLGNLREWSRHWPFVLA